jgi:hypothetical protein
MWRINKFIGPTVESRNFLFEETEVSSVLIVVVPTAQTLLFASTALLMI